MNEELAGVSWSWVSDVDGEVERQEAVEENFWENLEEKTRDRVIEVKNGPTPCRVFLPHIPYII